MSKQLCFHLKPLFFFFKKKKSKHNYSIKATSHLDLQLIEPKTNEM